LLPLPRSGTYLRNELEAQEANDVTAAETPIISTRATE